MHLMWGWIPPYKDSQQFEYQLYTILILFVTKRTHTHTWSSSEPNIFLKGKRIGGDKKKNEKKLKKKVL